VVAVRACSHSLSCPIFIGKGGYKPKPRPTPRPRTPTPPSPTTEPSSSRISFLPTYLPTISPECGFISCGFEALVENQLITAGSAQAARLSKSCRMTVSFANALASGINVFNSSNVQGPGVARGDFDLGSPNENCRPAGPGIGSGGRPNSRFPNCNPQGNMLILQNPSYSVRFVLPKLLCKTIHNARLGCSHTHSLYLFNHVNSTRTIVLLVDV
jgi:hypothetical protein